MENRRSKWAPDVEIRQLGGNQVQAQIQSLDAFLFAVRAAITWALKVGGWKEKKAGVFVLAAPLLPKANPLRNYTGHT